MLLLKILNRNIKTLNAILQGWTDVESAVSSALDSENSALIENEKYLDSIDGRTQVLSSSFQKMATSIIDSNLVKTILDITNVFVQLLSIADGVPAKILLVTVATLGLSAAFKTVSATQFAGNLKSVTSFIPNTIAKINSYQQALLAAAAASGTTVTQIQILGSTIKGLTASLVSSPLFWVAIAAGAIQVFTQISQAQQKAIDKAKELTDAYNQAQKAITDNVSTLKSLDSEFTRLSKSVGDYGENIALSADDYARYKDLVQQIVGISPKLITGYDSEGNAIANKNGLIERSIELLKEEQKLQLNKMVGEDATKDVAKGAIANYEQAISDLKKVQQKGVNEINVLMQPLLKSIYKEQGLSGNTLGIAISGFTKPLRDVLGDVDKFSEELDKIMSSMREMGVSESDIASLHLWALEYSNVLNSVQNAEKGFNSHLANFAQQAEGYDELSSAQKNFVTNYINGFKLIEDTDALYQEGLKLTQFVNELSENTDVKDAIDRLFSPEFSSQSLQAYSDEIEKIINFIAQGLGQDENELKLKLGFDINLDGLKHVLSNAQPELEDQAKRIQNIFNEFTLDEIQILINADDAEINLLEGSIDELRESYNAWQESLKNNNTLEETFKLSLDSTTNSVNILKTAIEEQSNTGRITFQTYSNLISQGEDYENLVEATANGYSLLSDKASEYNNQLVQQAIQQGIISGFTEKQIANLFELLIATSHNLQASKDLASVTSTLNSAFAEQIESGKLSLKTTLDIIDAGYGAALSIDKETGAVVLSAEAYVKLADAKISERIASLQINRSDLIRKLVEEKNAVDELSEGIMNTARARIYESQSRIIQANSGDLTAVNAEIAALEELRKNLDLVTLGEYDAKSTKSSSKSTKSSSKSTDAWKEAFDEQYKLLKHNESINKITVQQLYTDLLALDKKYFANNEKYLSEHMKNVEELYNIQTQLAKNSVSDIEHNLSVLQKLNNVVTQELSTTVNVPGGDADREFSLFKKGNYNEQVRQLEIMRDKYNELLEARTLYLSESGNYSTSDISNDDLIKEYSMGVLNAESRITDTYRQEVDDRLEMSEEYIRQRIYHDDWLEDSEKESYQRILAYLEEYHTQGKLTDKAYYELREEYMHKFYDAEKAEIEAIKDQMNDYINRIEKSVNKLLADEKKLIDARKKSIDYEIAQTEALITLEKKRMDVSNEVASAQREIATVLSVNQESYKYLEPETRALLFNEDDYNILSAKLSEINTKAERLYNDYWVEINNLTEDEVYLTEYLTSAYERQNSVLMERYKIASAELELEKARQNLANTQNERNTRLYMADTGTFQWVANPDSVKQAMEAVAEAEDMVLRAEKELNDLEIIQRQEAIIDSLNKESDYLDTSFEMLSAQWAETLEYIKELHEPTEEINAILREMAENTTPELQNIISLTTDAVQDFIDAIQYAAGNVGYPLFGPSTSGGNGGLSTSGSSSLSSGGSGSGSNVSELQVQRYLQNKIKWVTASPDEKVKLHAENESFRNAHGINQDNITYEEALKMLQTGNFEIFDSGGILRGIGGIKATSRDEGVLGPDITAKVMNPEKSKEFTNLVDNLEFFTDTPRIKELNALSEKFTKLLNADGGNALDSFVDGVSKMTESVKNYVSTTKSEITHNNYNLHVQSMIKTLNPLETIAQTFDKLTPLHNPGR